MPQNQFCAHTGTSYRIKFTGRSIETCAVNAGSALELARLNDSIVAAIDLAIEQKLTGWPGIS